MKNSLFFGIQLAFVDREEIQFSIIYLPKVNEVYYAIKGHGTYLNDKKIIVNNNADAAHAIIEFCGSLDKMYSEKKELLEHFLSTPKFVAGYLHLNACCFAFADLLAGRTDALVLSTKKPWDIIPGIMLCKEAGIEEIEFNDLLIYTKVTEIKSKILELRSKTK